MQNNFLATVISFNRFIGRKSKSKHLVDYQTHACPDESLMFDGQNKHNVLFLLASACENAIC